MIALASNCLLFETTAGEAVPLSSEMISIEMSGEAAKMFEPDFVDNAASAVFHYFKNDLGRESVTVAEFAEALEKALKSVGKKLPSETPLRASVMEADLRTLALECGAGCELVFFPRLRTELRMLLKDSPVTVRFSGLRDCVKTLTGARKWSPRCCSLQEQIISYLRECMFAERSRTQCSLLVT